MRSPWTTFSNHRNIAVTEVGLSSMQFSNDDAAVNRSILSTSSPSLCHLEHRGSAQPLHAILRMQAHHPRGIEQRHAAASSTRSISCASSRKKSDARPRNTSPRLLYIRPLRGGLCTDKNNEFADCFVSMILLNLI